MKWFSAVLIGFIIIVGMNRCTHDPFELEDMDSNPQDTTGVDPMDTMTMVNFCDPDTVYFFKDVLPILISNCAISGCHDPITAEDDVILNNYQNVIATGDIKAFDLDGSDLYERITEDDSDKIMPPSPQTPLNENQIEIIAKWITQGAQNFSCDEMAMGCPTDSVSYSMDVQPILQNSCLGCHSGSSPSGNLDFNSFSVLQNVALNGRLFGAVSWTQGFSPMPQGGAQLSECSISLIEAWINIGAPNN